MDPTNRNTALASAMVEELARCGVRYAALSPGSRSTPLALALWRQPAIEVAVLLDERCAGFFALGAAQATRTPAVVLTTSGTAAANLHPAVAEADEAGVPLIVLTADRPPELRGVGAGQTIDQLKLYGDSVRWFCEVGTHEADDAGLLHFRSVGCRAYALARGEPRPGPVHLNVAWREPLSPLARDGDVTATSKLALEGRGKRPLTASPQAAEGPLEPVVEALAEQLRARPRGLILAGRQNDSTLGFALAALSEATGYPILAEPTSQVRFGPHDRSRVIWTYDAIARQGPSALLPDLVLRFGDMPTSKSLRAWLSKAEVDQIVVAPWGWNEFSRIAAAVVRADPSKLARRLVENVEGVGHGEPPDWTQRWLRCGEAAASAIEERLDVAGRPTEPAAHAALARLYADNDLVYTASSMPIRDQEAFAAGGPSEVLFLANRGANGIDGLISSGIGAAAASGRPTWIVTGDLGLVHDMNGLAALRYAAAPVRIVVLNNQGGGIFELLPQADLLEREEFEALFGTPSGLDFAQIAALHGIPHHRMESMESVAAQSQETGLIEIPTDRRADAGLRNQIAETIGDVLSAQVT